MLFLEFHARRDPRGFANYCAVRVAPVPFLTCALVHDWHHYFNTENYGPVGLLDAIFKTNKTFKAWTSETVAAFHGDRAKARQAALEKLAQIEAEEQERIR